MGCHSSCLFYSSYAALAGILTITWFYPLPVLLQMTVYTSSILYIGSHISLKLMQIDEKTGEKAKPEMVSRHDAMMFPAFGSAALLSLYLAYKFLNPKWVNLLLSTYLTVLGSLAFAETTKDLLEKLTPLSWRRTIFAIPTVHLYPKIAEFLASEEKLGGQSVSLNHLLLYIFSFAMGIISMITKSWILHNIFGISFCIQILAIVSVGDFKRVSLLLVGAFFYDIFWVFGTQVMVTVAKSFEGPAKLIFPVTKDPWNFSILGLGDIVLPGIFLAMCLRFDYNNHLSRTTEKNTQTSCGHHEWFPKFYFYVVLVAYELGLLTTGLVMMVTAHAQPALLYLVPFCLLSLFGAATLNGQVHSVLEYTEEPKPETPIVESDKDK